MSLLHTLAAPAQLSQDIRKSRFFAQAAGVDDVSAALTFIEAARDALATHNCWAYRIGQSYRFTDDGEPAGTAGKPMLQAIDGQKLDRVVVVVTRWYGGIKLGAGGLARAYGGCAGECLRMATKTPIVDRIEVDVSCEFTVLPLLQARLLDLDAEALAARFDAAGAILHLRLPRARLDALRDLVGDLTRGRGRVDCA